MADTHQALGSFLQGHTPQQNKEGSQPCFDTRFVMDSPSVQGVQAGQSPRELRPDPSPLAQLIDLSLRELLADPSLLARQADPSPLALPPDPSPLAPPPDLPLRELLADPSRALELLALASLATASPAQLSGPPGKMPALRPAQYAALHPVQPAALHPVQPAALRPVQYAALRPVQPAALAADTPSERQAACYILVVTTVGIQQVTVTLRLGHHKQEPHRSAQSRHHRPRTSVHLPRWWGQVPDTNRLVFSRPP